MTKTATLNTKKALRNRTRLEWVLFIALLLILFLWAASRYEWWPLNGPKADLGTAFYTSRQAALTNPGGTASTVAGGTNGTASTAGRTASTTNSSTTSNTSTTTNNGSGTPDPGGGGSSSLLSLAAGINAGDAKQDIAVSVNGLNQNCAVTVNLPLGLGKQEVCTYSDGSRTITVTYLNDRVLSASLANL